MAKPPKDMLSDMEIDVRLQYDWELDVIQAEGAPFSHNDISSKERTAFLSGVHAERDRFAENLKPQEKP